jgi:hypothetical protein
VGQWMMWCGLSGAGGWRGSRWSGDLVGSSMGTGGSGGGKWYVGGE